MKSDGESLKDTVPHKEDMHNSGVGIFPTSKGESEVEIQRYGENGQVGEMLQKTLYKPYKTWVFVR